MAGDSKSLKTARNAINSGDEGAIIEALTLSSDVEIDVLLSVLSSTDTRKKLSQMTSDSGISVLNTVLPPLLDALDKENQLALNAFQIIADMLQDDEVKSALESSTVTRMRTTLGMEVNTEAPKEGSTAKVLFKLFPFLSLLSQSIEKTGLSASKLAAFYQPASQAVKAAKSLQITGAILSGLDWIALPITYLGYRISGTPFPYSLSKGLKWTYSMALFGLAVATLAAPAVALPIAIASAGLVATVSLGVLGKQLWGRFQLPKKIKKKEALDKEIERLKMEDKIICQKLLDQKNSPEKAGKILEQRRILLANILTKTEKSYELKTEIALTRSKGAAADKAVGCFLSGMALAGLVTALFVPPVGLGLLVATGTLGLGYLVGRVTITPIVAIVKSKFFKKKSVPVNEAELQQAVVRQDLAYSEQKGVHDTLSIVKSLFGQQHKAAIAKILVGIECEAHDLDTRIRHIEQRIHDISQQEDLSAALIFMQNVAENLVPNCTSVELRQFFTNIEDFDKLIPVLERAVKTGLENMDEGNVDADVVLDERSLQSICRIKVIKKYVSQCRSTMNKSNDNAQQDSLGLSALLQASPDEFIHQEMH